MVVVGLLHGWYRWTGILMLGFEGICRPGEPLAALRCDLLLAEDLVVEDPSVAFLRIRHPKGRRRGIGAVQHSKISNLRTARYLSFAYGNLSLSSPLYPGSAASFRTRWDFILSFLLVSRHFQLTPASLRAGGAVHAYRSDEELMKLMWRMRLRNIDTLQAYLQEVGAASIFVQLSAASRDRISKAALLYEALMDIF